jgi:hypothetical protein
MPVDAYLPHVCGICDARFVSDPATTPVLELDGQRLAVCTPCVVAINTTRKAQGLEPLWGRSTL